MPKKQLLGEMLVSAGYITEQQAKESLEIQNKTGKLLGDVLIEKGYIKQIDLMRVLENQHRVPYVDLDRIEVDNDIIKQIPVELARRNNLAPVKIDRNVLYIAIGNPKNFQALDEVHIASGMDVQPMLASDRSIKAFIDRIYGNEYAQRALSDLQRESNYDDVVTAITSDTSSDVASAPIVRLVNALMEQAVGMGASDIHIEPFAAVLRVRMRVDGALTKVLETPVNTANAIIARIKILGNLNIAERRLPQDGRFNLSVMGRVVDIRLSTLPTVYGEKVVMRLLDRSTFLVPKSKMGFTDKNLEKFDSLLKAPHGIILVAGPTGSGKSTTLYTMLSELNNTQDNIITVEDPVEYMIEGLNQVSVNPAAGLTFATGLRSILRQDPDIIMVGEIRDVETVEIAIRAAITGHLVLSTIHTNDAVSTVFRLIDMGIPSYMVAASLVGVVSQRLLRIICESCKSPYIPSEAEFRFAGLDPERVGNQTFYKGIGCSSCNQTGYKGRMAVHEILTVDQDLRKLIAKNATLGDMLKSARIGGMETLHSAAVDVLYRGLTTIDEVISITHSK